MNIVSFGELYGQPKHHNLFPNGDAENLFINKIIGEAGYGTHAYEIESGK